MSVAPSLASRVYLVWGLAELGEFAEANRIGEEAVRLAEGIDHPYSMIIAYFGLGHLHLITGELHKAIPILQRAFDLTKTSNIPIWSPLIASALGSGYVLSERPGDALPFLEQAVEEATSMKLMQSQSLRLTRLGTCYLVADRTEDALRAAGQALELSRARRERSDEAYALSLLGEIASHYDSADIEIAKARYGEALHLADELGMRPLVARCHLGLGTLHRFPKMLAKAREHLDLAATMYQEMGTSFWLEKVETEKRQLALL
jgi:tetratricopeptide (TPR) repeat protein